MAIVLSYALDVNPRLLVIWWAAVSCGSNSKVLSLSSIGPNGVAYYMCQGNGDDASPSRPVKCLDGGVAALETLPPPPVWRQPGSSGGGGVESSRPVDWFWCSFLVDRWSEVDRCLRFWRCVRSSTDRAVVGTAERSTGWRGREAGWGWGWDPAAGVEGMRRRGVSASKSSLARSVRRCWSMRETTTAKWS